MEYIVLDIEFNGRKFASELPMEVIEIGAVRLDSSLQPVDDFSSMIKPVYFAKLNSFIKKKTGIAQEEIDGADGFPAVITAFREWLDRSGEFILLTWGGEDLKRIVLDTRMHGLDDAFWLAVDCYDLLKGYTRYKNVTNDVSVEAALADLGIEAEGMAHRALDDARMTAHVFAKIFATLDIDNRKHRYKDQFSNSKERRMVKNAIRTLIQRKTTPEWDFVAEHFLKDKVPLTDPRKLAELQQYFAVEAAKEKAKPTPPQPAPKQEPEES